MKIAIVDYGSGNVHSVLKAVQRAASESGIEADVSLTDDPGALVDADRLILPGVGAFADCARNLHARSGVADALTEAARAQGKPLLGICVGMQLLADEGQEFGKTPGLGWIGGTVKPLAPEDASFKVPHMGWNALEITSHPLFEDIENSQHAYFVHSYHFEVTDKAHRIAECHYGQSITAAVAKGNIVGVQFHPEKSQKLGLRIIRNWLVWPGQLA